MRSTRSSTRRRRRVLKKLSRLMESKPHVGGVLVWSIRAGFTLLLFGVIIWLATLLLSPVRAQSANSARLYLPFIARQLRTNGRVTGELYTFLGPSPIRGTTFYFTPGRGPTNAEPPTAIVGPEHRDIVGMTDSEGRFALESVSPGNYFLLVWAPYNWVFAPISRTDLTPRLFAFDRGLTYDLGRVEMVWP